jgi:hypothetical protein
MSSPEITNSHVLCRLNEQESRLLERKKDVPSEREIRATLVGFANALKIGEWAVLFMGIEDDGTVVGLSNVENAQKTVTKVAKEQCYPAVDFDCRVIRTQEKDIVAVVIPFSLKLPHFAGPAYLRMGCENKLASEDQFKKLIAKHNEKARRILEAKGENVSVELQCGSAQLVPYGQEPVERRIYKIIDCDAHEIVIEEVGRSKIIRRPIKDVESLSTQVAGKALHLVFSNVNPDVFYW